MQFFQQSRQGRPPKPKRDMRAVAPEEEPQGTGNGRPSREIKDLQSRLKELERALQERLPVQSNPTRNTSPPRAAVEGRSPPVCYKCGEVGHYWWNCPRNSGAKMTGHTEGGGHPTPSGIRGPLPKRKVQMDSGQKPGTECPGDPERCGCSSQSVLSLQQPPRIPGFFPRCSDRESDHTPPPLTQTPRAPRLLVPLPHASGGGGSIAD